MNAVHISGRVHTIDGKECLYTQEDAQITLITTHDLWWKRFQQALAPLQVPVASLAVQQLLKGGIKFRAAGHGNAKMQGNFFSSDAGDSNYRQAK